MSLFLVVKAALSNIVTDMQSRNPNRSSALASARAISLPLALGTIHPPWSTYAFGNQRGICAV